MIVAPGGPYTDVDVAVRFKPISGGEDASAGLVFRFSEGRYYVVRANALDDNFNLYYYDWFRHQITGARVKAPALGQWHKLRITAEGDHIMGWLNDQLLIDHHDSQGPIYVLPPVTRPGRCGCSPGAEVKLGADADYPLREFE